MYQIQLLINQIQKEHIPLQLNKTNHSKYEKDTFLTSKNKYCNSNNIHLIRIPYGKGPLDITEQRLKEIFIKEGILSYE